MLVKIALKKMTDTAFCAPSRMGGSTAMTSRLYYQSDKSNPALAGDVGRVFLGLRNQGCFATKIAALCTGKDFYFP